MPTQSARYLNEAHRNLGNRNPEPRFRKLHRGYLLKNKAVAMHDLRVDF